MVWTGTARKALTKIWPSVWEGALLGNEKSGERLLQISESGRPYLVSDAKCKSVGYVFLG
ncbi:hypothetical protein JCM12178A_13180 [Salidesulfovibrio brasiliensis]